MMSAKGYLRRGLLILAGLASVALSLLGIFAFLWGVDLQHTSSKDVWTGVLLFGGPVLTAAVFSMLFNSPKWQMRLMWLVVCASFVMTGVALHIHGSYAHLSFHETFSAIQIACQPLVFTPILIAVLVTISRLFTYSNHSERL